MNELEFEYLNDCFLSKGANASAAELHGMLCGRLCGGEPLSQSQWRTIAIEFLGIKHLHPTEQTLDLLDQIQEVTSRLLQDQNFTFVPLLPDDDASLSRRIVELSQWCKSYLVGLGASGLAGESQLASDTAEALRDIAQIANVDADEQEAEENEVYWNELVEYIKVAVLNIYAELRIRHTINSKVEPGSSSSIH